MKKRTIGLIIALALCLTLSGCRRNAEQRESETVYNPSSTENSIESSTESSIESSTESSSESSTESSSESSTESSTESNTESSTESNTGKNTGKNSGKNTGKNSGKNSDKNTGSNTDNNSAGNTGNNSGSNAGSSGSGSVTPPAQENKNIKSVVAINNLTVDYGTEAAAAMAKLPNTVVLNCDDGTTVQTGVTSWALDRTYNAQPQSETTCIATGTVQIPSGYTYAGTLTVTANITVRGGDKTIKELVTTVSGGDVDYGTSEEDAKAKLPGTVELKTYAGGTVSANVTWNLKDGATYNTTPASAAAVAYVGTVAIPDGYAYAGTLTVTANITVRGGDRTIKELSAAVSGIEVAYNTSEAAAKVKLPGKVELATYAGGTVSANVTWNLKSGETYNATPDSTAAVAYVGTVAIPDGYTCTGTLTAETTITVRGGDVTIQGLSAAVSGIEVAYNTSEAAAKAKLPGTVELKTYAGGTVSANVTWNLKSDAAYNAIPASALTVAYVGTVTIPDGYTYAGTLTAETTITVRGGDKTIKELITTVSGGDVDYGTSEAAAKAKLPGTVELATYAGGKVSANVTWERKSGETYNTTPASATDVAYVGTVQIPSGYAYAGTLTAETKIKVRGGDKTIQGLVTTVSSFTVDYGTSEEAAKAKLPGTVELATYAGGKVSADVTWERKSGETYNTTPASALAVAYVGTVTIPDGYTCTGTPTAETKITVRGGDKTIQGLVTTVSSFTVDYGITETDAIAKLPGTVELKTYAGGTVSADVTWNVKSGETYNATPASGAVVTYVGTIAIPDGYTYMAGTLTAETKITVRGGDETIQGLVTTVSSFTVDYGTTETDAIAKLPGTVELKMYAGGTVSANVTWNLKDGATYNATPDSTAAVAYVGTVAIPDGYTYMAGTLTAETTITVRGGDETIKGLSAAVSGIEVAYNTTETDAIAKLPKEVKLETYDNNKTVLANVTWNLKSGAAYDATPDSTTAVAYVGTVTIPDGYTYMAGTLTAETTITVWSGDKTIKELKGPVGGFKVNYGTSEAEAIKRLPGEVKLIPCTGVSMYVQVKWTQKSGETYNQNPANDADVTYIGTVQIPDGYYFDGKTTMETTITVLQSGKTATPKKVTLNYESPDVYIESYIASINEKNCPDKVRLDCEDGSPITVKLNQAKWNQCGSIATMDKYTIYSFTYSYREITLPDGYEFASTSSDSIVGYVHVKFRDDSGLKEAAAAAEALLDRIAGTELAALTYPDKTYKAPNGTEPSEVSDGVKFIEEGQIESQVAELKKLSADAVFYRGDGNKSQVDINDLTKTLNDAVAALKKILDTKSQMGTGFTTEKILFNVSKALKSLEGNGNYAYDPDNQPLKPQQSDENCLTFPSQVRVVINADGDEGDVKLTWSIMDSTYADIKSKADGTQYVWIHNVPTEPKDASFTVRATEYYDGSTWVPLDKQVEAYNNCIVGAPISKYEPKVHSDDIPKLTSGKEDSQFTILVPFQYDKRLIEIENEPDKITVEDTSEYSAGKLLDNFKVIEAHTYNYYYPGFCLAANVAQLPAVINPADADQCVVKGKVKISVPADIITLTDDARKEGWYVPDDKWEAEADVWVYNPAVTVNSAQLSTDKSKVTVDFTTAHWGASREVLMALVPDTADTFDGTAAGSFVSSAVAVAADEDYTAEIPVSGITAGSYKVWVKVGNEAWQKSNKSYTQSGTVSPGGSGE